MHYWNREAECMEAGKLRELQNARLVRTVKHAYRNVPAYKKKFDEIGLRPEDIKGVEDLPKIPFTTKVDFRDNYPFGMFAVPMDQVVRVHASSGTTGKSTVVGYTRADIAAWAEMMARTLGRAAPLMAISSRMPTDTAFLPVVWARIMGRSLSAHR